MTTNTAARLQAVRHETIEEVRTQKFVTLPSKYATGERDFLAECLAEGILSEEESGEVRYLDKALDDGLLTM